MMFRQKHMKDNRTIMCPRRPSCRPCSREHEAQRGNRLHQPSQQTTDAEIGPERFTTDNSWTDRAAKTNCCPVQVSKHSEIKIFSLYSNAKYSNKHKKHAHKKVFNSTFQHCSLVFQHLLHHIWTLKTSHCFAIKCSVFWARLKE